MTGFNTMTACPSGRTFKRDSDPKVMLLLLQQIRGIV
ncbi:hypothetical protein SAMN05216233_12252 [Desulfoluna spongiiphila]|uniref:Uncharacterized protein n=1 Tax=Desulfoluna spongiiphila TaxID=419481 RepID=A0A1G5IWW9_9BACT|nr:hypothetical protein SAMN05216233_12252 [Desulfoluna spongiiphila]VVS93333.1 hypothetical protein DBB_29010 [Desulfoluna spongiiphila]